MVQQRGGSLWSRSKQQLARQKQQEKLRDDSLDEQQQTAVATALDEATELIRCSRTGVGVGVDKRTLEPEELKGLGAAELMRCATPMRKVERGRRYH